MSYLYALLRKRLFVVVVAVAFLTVPTQNTTSAGDVTDPILEDIVAAWQIRQDALQSVRFEWTASVMTPRGSRTRELMDVVESIDEVASHPPEDVVHDRTLQLVLDGGMVKHSWKGLAWSPQPDSPGFYLHSRTTASDGDTSKVITNRIVNTFSREVYPGGYILEGPENQDTKGNYHIDVLLYFARPLDSTFGCLNEVRHGRWARTRKPSLSFRSLEGVRCAVVQQQYGPVRLELWIDPQRSYTIRRYLTFVGEALMTQVTASYREDDQVGWVPHSWRADYWIADKLNGSYTAQMISYEINPTIDISEFRPEFPPGSVVSDHRGGPAFFVRENGSRRVITEQERERGATYRDIAETETGEAGRVTARSISVVWMILTCIMLLLALVLCVTLGVRSMRRAS